MKDFIATRAAWIEEAPAGVGAARRLSEITDEAVGALASAASSLAPGRWAVIALGGWGAGALLPASDLDILVLSEAPAERLKPFVEALLYPLWDAGLKVGHQVRSPKQQLKAMREDLKTCTAALTARPLAGDLEWAEKSSAAWAADAHRRRKRLVAALSQRARPGSPYLLEPDLKEGAGGRRDYDELVWRAAIATGRTSRDVTALVEAGLVEADEARAVTAAAETVSQARWRLQRAGFGDRMSLDAVDELDGTGGPTTVAEAVQAALADTAAALQAVRARSEGSAPRTSALSSAAVLELVARGLDAIEELQLGAQRGALEELVPGMRALMACRRPGIGHELTVGAHCLKAACLVSTLADDGPLGRSLRASDGRVVRVAALIHDIGKCDVEPGTVGAGHASRGAASAVKVARRFGLTEDEASAVGALVRLHLALPEIALRGDLDDENVILAAAAEIGEARLLAPLHVLTAVDSIATGPSTWTTWTSSLVSTLVSRLEAAFSEDVDGAGIARRGEAVRTSTLAAMSGAADAERAFVEAAPLRYLASRQPADVSRDARLVSELSSSAGARLLLAVTMGAVPGTHVVTVAAPDRPELLARLAGAIALAGLDILSVDAYGGPGGIALDSFVVTSATNRPASPDSFAKLERLANAALKDRLELATRLAERRRHYPARTSGRVEVRVSQAGWDTLLEVRAPDRPGLLYDVARAVSLSGLDIRWAKAQTIEGMARDIFHVVGPDGGRVDDAGMLGHVAMRVREAV